jgi:hypothetical protein
VAAERAVTWAATEETTMKLVHASDDGGATWQQVATVGPMNWPQVLWVGGWGRGAGFRVTQPRCFPCCWLAPPKDRPLGAVGALGCRRSPAVRPGAPSPPLPHPPTHPPAHALPAQLISCASGVYLIGTERHFSPDNNLVISKMLDQKGAPCCAASLLLL